MERNMTVILYTNVEDAPFVVGTTRLETAGATNLRELQNIMHNQKLSSDNFEELVVIKSSQSSTKV